MPFFYTITKTTFSKFFLPCQPKPHFLNIPPKFCCFSLPDGSDCTFLSEYQPPVKRHTRTSHIKGALVSLDAFNLARCLLAYSPCHRACSLRCAYLSRDETVNHRARLHGGGEVHTGLHRLHAGYFSMCSLSSRP